MAHELIVTSRSEVKRGLMVTGRQYAIPGESMVLIFA
jgi:hypothetical protein